MSDFQGNSEYPLTQGAKRIASRPSVPTLYRWAQKGVRGVKLETVMMGGRRYTSDEAVARFFARLSQPRASSPTPSPSPTPATPSRLRAAQIARANDRAGSIF